jgi:cytochrome b6-f complex iron-sulfur subunit
MSQAAAIAVVVAVIVVLGGVTLLTFARKRDVRGAGALSGETRRRDRAAREGVASPVAARTGREVEADAREAQRGGLAVLTETVPAPWVPPDPEAVGVSRRMFFNRASVTLMGVGLGSFTAASIVAFLWPSGAGGFGSKVSVGKLDDIIAGIRSGGGFFYAPEARAWITQYPADALPKAKAVYSPQILSGMEAGVVALYQKCPHLGCRVPECSSSQWFECPCHGSQYNRVGEKKAGPAPRGMDRFPITVAPNGDVTVDTGVVVPGPPIGTNTTGQEAEGPHCVGGGEGEH